MLKQEDRIPFAKLIGELAIAFGRDLDRETIEVFFKYLSNNTFYQVETAVTEIIGNDERFPPLSRIRTLAYTKKRGPTIHRENLEQIEEVVLPNDLPRTKEDFFRAMEKLTMGI